jgi:starvation-inducible DNA-binding protein
MLAELCIDNEQLVGFMRDAHFLCEASMTRQALAYSRSGIDQAERRAWFLFECGRKR